MLDCIVDAGSHGLTRTTGSARVSELLTHVHGGTLPVDTLHTDGPVNVDKCMKSVAKAPAHHSMGEPVD
jgi:hypothetical protein